MYAWLTCLYCGNKLLRMDHKCRTENVCKNGEHFGWHDLCKKRILLEISSEFVDLERETQKLIPKRVGILVPSRGLRLAKE